MFLRDGHVIGLSLVLRSPCFSLGIGVEERGLEIAGLESRSGLIMGDFHRWAGREGRRAGQGAVNVGFSAFHEGRGAGKTDPRGGHGLVSRKEIVNEKGEVHEKDVLLSTEIKACSTASCRGRLTTGFSYPGLKHAECSWRSGRPGYALSSRPSFRAARCDASSNMRSRRSVYLASSRFSDSFRSFRTTFNFHPTLTRYLLGTKYSRTGNIRVSYMVRKHLYTTQSHSCVR